MGEYNFDVTYCKLKWIMEFQFMTLAVVFFLMPGSKNYPWARLHLEIFLEGGAK